jgi:hypothetical protein
MELLENLKFNAVQIIQLMLAPAVMINACGLLLLGINNKFSNVVSRIRLLNDEKRRLMIKVGDKTPETEEIVRLESISKQISSLVIRGNLVKNSVLSFVIAIALFVFTSLSIGVLSILTISLLNFLIISSFLSGMIAVFIGTIFMGLEAKRGYEIILFEVKAHE